MKGKRISIETLKNACASPGEIPLRQFLQPACNAADHQSQDLSKTVRPLKTSGEAGPGTAQSSAIAEQGQQAQLSKAAQASGTVSQDPVAPKRSFNTGQQLLVSQQPAQSVNQKPSSRSFGDFYFHLKSLRDARKNRSHLEEQIDMSNLRFARWTVSGRRGEDDSTQKVLLLHFQSPY
jgi:hypothetical protein